MLLAMNGTVSANSIEGKGSIFTVRLPCAEPAPVAERASLDGRPGRFFERAAQLPVVSGDNALGGRRLAS